MEGWNTPGGSQTDGSPRFVSWDAVSPGMVGYEWTWRGWPAPSGERCPVGFFPYRHRVFSGGRFGRPMMSIRGGGEICPTWVGVSGVGISIRARTIGIPMTGPGGADGARGEIRTACAAAGRDRGPRHTKRRRPPHPLGSVRPACPELTAAILRSAVSRSRKHSDSRPPMCLPDHIAAGGGLWGK